MNKKVLFQDFITTFIATCVVVFFIALTIELHLLFKTEDDVYNETIKIEHFTEFYTINDLEKKLLESPNSIAIMLKLARLYDLADEDDNANKMYQRALKTSNRSNFALYSYALFCAKHGAVAISTSLAEELIGDRATTNIYKGRIYKSIGDYLYNSEQYQAAVMAFQVAYKYAKTMKDKEFLDVVKTSYADAYQKLADIRIKDKDVNQAISDLENSIQLFNSAPANYKLALIYLEVDKKHAERYMSKAFKIDPYIVNPYLYNFLLDDLIKISKDSGDVADHNFYSLKKRIFIKNLKEKYIYKGDIVLDNSNIQFSSKKLFHNKVYSLFFDVHSTTKEPIKNLFIKADITLNHQLYSVTKRVVSPSHVLEPYENIEQVRFDLPETLVFYDLNKQNDIIVKYYAKKHLKSPWTLIKIEMINF